MTTIYISEQGALIRKTGRRLLVEKNKQILLDIPVIKTGRLFLFGNIQVTTQAMAMLLDNGIDVSFFTSRGRLRGLLSSGFSKNIFLRLAQYERWRDNTYKLRLCRAIIRAKLLNMNYVIKRHLKNYPEEDYNQSFQTINRGLGGLSDKEELAGLLGIEGSSSGAYFSAFSRMFRQDLKFKKRLRHPSPDPVNALLSLGYVMVTNEIASLLEGMAFDPYLGFLHGIKYGRRSLALDLVEEFRQPLIDTFTLKLANLKIFKEADFEQVTGEGLHLNDVKFKEYLSLYESRLKEKSTPEGDTAPSWRELLHKQVKSFEKALFDGKDYEPFTAERRCRENAPGCD
jgi:CRISP-associated protein Cas1